MATTERERKTQENTMKIIRKYGGYVYKNAQNMYTEKGRPDLCACIPVTVERLMEIYGPSKVLGLFVGFEMKRPGHLNEVSEAQKIVGKQINNAGGIWLAIDDPLVAESVMIKFTEPNYKLACEKISKIHTEDHYRLK